MIPLRIWAERLWGEYAPTDKTLQRWTRDRKILPMPQKRGRAYFVKESAQFVDPKDPDYINKVAEALYESEKA